MNSILKTFSIFMFLFLSITAKAVTPAEWGTIINLSGKQRMLTQKMSKELLLVSLDINKGENLNNLKKTAELFDITLNGLKSGEPSLGLVASNVARADRQLEKVFKLWSPMYEQIKAFLQDPSSKDAAKYVLDNNLSLLKQMNRTVRQYEKTAQSGDSGSNLATTINLAGKQRMLTQKMTKELFLVIYGYNPDKNRTELKNTYGLFERTLKGLKNGDSSLGLAGVDIPEANTQLDKVESIWGGLKEVYEKVALGNEISAEEKSKIEKENLELLKEMNKAVMIYEKNI